MSEIIVIIYLHATHVEFTKSAHESDHFLSDFTIITMKSIEECFGSDVRWGLRDIFEARFVAVVERSPRHRDKSNRVLSLETRLNVSSFRSDSLRASMRTGRVYSESSVISLPLSNSKADMISRAPMISFLKTTVTFFNRGRCLRARSRIFVS